MSTSLSGFTGARGPAGSSSGQKMAGYKLGQTPNFSPEQMQLFQSLFSHVGPNSNLSRLAMGDEQAFQQQEAPALRQFGQLQGDIASRFSGAGIGARRGSGFQNSINQATSDFAQDLQSRRQTLQRQALQDLMGISESLLHQKPYEQYLIPKKKSFLESLLGGLSGGLGQGLGTLGGFGAGKSLGIF